MATEYSLFDFGGEPCDHAGESPAHLLPSSPPSIADDLPESTWVEVPQARFNSWSVEQQLAYCARRDEDAALCCETLEQAQWFQQRAQMYREMIHAAE